MINTVHWNEPDEAKAHIIRIAAETLTARNPADQDAYELWRMMDDADDPTLAHFCDILKGN